jgi:hypothetical protein
MWTPPATSNGQLFGWTFKQQGRYTVVLNDGQPIAGMVDVRSRPESSGKAESGKETQAGFSGSANGRSAKLGLWVFL